MTQKLDKEKGPSFTLLGDILKKQLRGITDLRFNTSISLKKQWSEMVGQTIADHSHVLYLKKDQLHVAVDNSTWLNELHFIKDKILEKLNQSQNQFKIQDIKFKIQPSHD